MSQMMMQINGNTILHMYCIDYTPLQLMLEFMKNKRKNMLASILMKNNKGETPIDVALRFESPKTVNLLLQGLSELKDGSYSRLIYEKFNRLLGMNLVSFHDYLDSCYFQTIQMKSYRFLKLKDDDFEDRVALTHSTCLIDEKFLHKYTNEKEVAHIKNGAKGDDEPPPTALIDHHYQMQKREHDSSEEDESEDPSGAKNYSDEDEGSVSHIMHDNEAFRDSEESKHHPSSKVFSRQESDPFERSPDTGAPLRPSDIRLEDEKDSDFDNEGGGSEEVEMIEAASPDSPTKLRRNRESQAPAYDPKYSVFNTEAKFLGTQLEAGRMHTYDNAYVVNDYYIDNIRADETEIRKERTKRLIPPRQVNLTEQDEMRMREFEKQLKLTKEAREVQERFEKLDRQIERLDTRKMSPVEMEKMREHERRLYYQENLRNNMCILDIKAIEFDWLFGKKGSEFLNTIATCNSIDLFSLDIIKSIVLFFWQYYKVRILFASLLPFLLYFCTFLVYTTYLHEEDLKKGEEWNDYRIASYSLMILILLLAAYHIFLEVLYFKEKGFKYFLQFWNWVNLLTIGLSIATVIIDYLDLDEGKYFIPVAA